MIVSDHNNSCLFGHNHVWAQIKCVWAQSCLGTIVSGNNRVGAQSCLGRIMSGHSRVRPIMYGHKHGGTKISSFLIRVLKFHDFYLDNTIYYMA